MFFALSVDVDLQFASAVLKTLSKPLPDYIYRWLGVLAAMYPSLHTLPRLLPPSRERS